MQNLPPNSISPHISHIIELAWDDKASFDSIFLQTGLSEGEVIAIMRREMKPSSFRMWRKRVSGRKAKHAAKVGAEMDVEDDAKNDLPVEYK